MLIPEVVSKNPDYVYLALDRFAAGLPGSAPDTVSEVLQMHYGIGAGLVIDQLFENGFFDISGSKVGFGFGFIQLRMSGI